MGLHPEFPQSNGFVERAIQTINKTLYYCRKGGPILSHFSATHNQKQLQYICLRVADEKKAANTRTLAKHQHKQQSKTRETNSQRIQRTSTIE